MAGQKLWGWDLDEMRSVPAMVDGEPERPLMIASGFTPINAVVNREAECPLIMVSGFTPINQPGWTTEAPKQLGETESTSKPKADRKTKAPNRSKTQLSATASGKRSRKSGVPKKTKKTKVAGKLQCQDISKGLSRTKPAPSVNGALLAQSPTASEFHLLEQRSDAESSCGTLFESGYLDKDLHSERSFRPLESGKKYQVAHVNRDNSRLDAKTNLKNDEPSVPSTLHVAGPKVCRKVSGQDDSNIDDNSDIRLEPQEIDDDAVQDFAVPPSAQTRTIVNQGKISQIVESSVTLKASQEDYFNSDDIFGDDVDPDEFPMDNDCIEEIMQCMEPSAEQLDLYDDWRPQDFSDDGLVFNDPGSDLPHATLPPARRDPLSIHEETPGVALSDGPIPTSSPLYNSQDFLVLSQISGNATKAEKDLGKKQEKYDDCFDDDDLDEGLADLAADGSDMIQPQTPLTSPEKPSTPKLQWMPPKTYTPAKSSQVPVSPTDAPHLVPVNKDGEFLPFTRPPFPKPIRDRSPILGLTNRTVLRICFRIGEALSAAAVASRSNTDAIIEFYARIVMSEREPSGGYKQFFQFGDLFTDKPPYLDATYSLWKGVALWNVDSKIFIGEQRRGKMARVMGRIKRCEQGGGCEMIVVSIWEVDWEDVGVAKGIVCS